MRFGPISLAAAEGKILAHNISGSDGNRILRKGQILDAEAVVSLQELGYDHVYVAEIEPADVHEDEAAGEIAAALLGPGLEATAPHTGRVNVRARALGVLQVNVEALNRLNQIEGFTIATLIDHSVVRPGQRVATIKIIPYAVPAEALARAEALTADQPILAIHRIEPQEIGIVLVGSRGAWQGLTDRVAEAIRKRVEALECSVREVAFAPLEEPALARVLSDQVSAGARLVVVAGETAIMDTNDLVPRAIRHAGGTVEQLGLPMDPGHLLLLAYLDEVPIVGAPGCVRSPSPDGFDVVLPRLLAGEHLTARDLQVLGHGGLLSNPRKHEPEGPWHDGRFRFE